MLILAIVLIVLVVFGFFAILGGLFAAVREIPGDIASLFANIIYDIRSRSER